MSLRLLTPQELIRRKTVARAQPEYIAFFARMPAGHGGLAKPEEEGLAAPQLRRELERAAAAHGVFIRFVNGLPGEVAFEVDGPVPAARRHRRHQVRRQPTQSVSVAGSAVRKHRVATGG